MAGIDEYESPLSKAQTDELREFLRTHHPPFYEEVTSMIDGGMQGDLPVLFSLLYGDMLRFRLGLTTRYMQFASEPSS